MGYCITLPETSLLHQASLLLHKTDCGGERQCTTTRIQGKEDPLVRREIDHMDALKDKEEINLVGVTESLVNWDKAIEGFGYVDDKNAITRILVSLVINRCHPLLIKLYPDGENSYWKHGHGNGGFIRWEAKQSSPGGSTVTLYSVYPITAKHNLRTA